MTTEVHGKEVVVSVRDTGIGIAPEYLPRVFEMFSQVTPALERAQGGLGIGLALVKGLVALHGGTIKVNSRGHNKGSEFIVRLPLAENPDGEFQTLRDSKQQSVAGSPCRILVVDDLRDSAESLAMMLQIMGHETHIAHDGLEAVQAATTLLPDVVLLDIGLPKMNSYEAARLIRNKPLGEKIVLIALTGWGQDEDKRKALAAGFDHHLAKPVDPSALEKLLAMIGRRGST